MKIRKSIAIIITAVIIALCASAVAEVGDRGEFYPRLAVVTGWELIEGTNEYLISCTDKDGEVWEFFGEEEDAHIGNIYSLLMWSMGENEEEDEIIEVYHEGRMTEDAMYSWVTGEWRE